MNFAAHAISYHESGDRDMTPNLSLERNQNWSLMAMQPSAPLGTGGQTLDIYQSASSVPNLGLAQHAPPELQEALTKQRPETMDDSHILDERTGHVQEDVTRKTNWTQYPNEDDWEQHKPKIIDLYGETTLKEVMATMKRDHDFKARYASGCTFPLRMRH